MSVEPLASLDDLADLGIEVTDANVAESLLASVSSEVRAAAGVPITRTTSTVLLETYPSRRITLPGAPVRSVESVELDGTPLVEGRDFVVRSGALWRVGRTVWQTIGELPGELEVTYEHGFDVVPGDIVRTVCLYVAAGLNAAEEGFESTRGLQYMSVDDFREGYATGDNEVVDPAGLTDRTKADLAARFGGAGPVVYRSVS